MSEVELLRNIPGLEGQELNRSSVLVAKVGNEIIDIASALEAFTDRTEIKIEKRGESGKFYPYTFQYKSDPGIFVAHNHYYDKQAEIGSLTILHPEAKVEGPSKVGTSCEIDASAHILASHLGRGCIVGVGSTVGPNSTLGDFAYSPTQHLWRRLHY